MYSNQKARAKDKYSKNKKTGGGPQETFTAAEEIVLSHMKASSSAQLCGLEGGIDSIAEPSVDIEKEVSDSAITGCEDSECSGIINADRILCPPQADDCKELRPVSSTAGISGKRKLEKKENTIYSLEEKRLRVEIQLLNNRLHQEEEIFNLKKELLQVYIKKATDDPSAFLNNEF